MLLLYMIIIEKMNFTCFKPCVNFENSCLVQFSFLWRQRPQYAAVYLKSASLVAKLPREPHRQSGDAHASPFFIFIGGARVIYGQAC